MRRQTGEPLVDEILDSPFVIVQRLTPYAIGIAWRGQAGWVKNAVFQKGNSIFSLLL